jgi:hypothetical protein
MKRHFVSKKFTPEHLDIIAKADQILTDYEAQGYDLSLRQLYYQFVSRNWLPNTERSYKNLGNIISDARLAGLLDWDMIKDRGREVIANNHWGHPSEIIEACAQQFRHDLWADQENYVEVMVEKQALEGVLIPVCREHDVRFTANKGYSSSSAMYEAGGRYGHQIANMGKKVHVIYLGDHDPSGIDMGRDVKDRSNLFARTRSGVIVHRIALNMDQIDELHPPENPAKLTDSRANEYVARFGDSSWELDAIEPAMLARLVTDAIEDLKDPDIWDASVARQQLARDALMKVAKNKRLFPR